MSGTPTGGARAVPASANATSIWGIAGGLVSNDPIQTAQRHIQSLHEQLAKATITVGQKDEQLAATRLENEALRRAVEQKDSELFNAQAEIGRLRKRTEALQVHVAELELQMQSARRLNAGLSERLCLEEMELEAEAVLGRVKAAKAELLAATANGALSMQPPPLSAASPTAGALRIGGASERNASRAPGQTLSWKLLDSNNSRRMGSEKSDDGEGDMADVNTRKANSTAFDTLSNASINTEDGAGTYTNSEYTSHLGVLSDEDAEDEDEKPTANGRHVRGDRK